MAGIPSQYEGLLTDRYAALIDPLPEERTIRDLIQFVPGAERSGANYKFPVLMSDEQGVTFSNSGDITDLNSAVSAVSKEASISAPDIFMVAELGYSMAVRGQNGNSKDGSAPSYVDQYDNKVMSMLRSCGNHVELQLLHGCGSGSTALDDVGVVYSTAVASGSGTTYASATVVFTKASYVKDLWDNVQNAYFDVLNSAGTAIVAHNVKVVNIADVSKCQVTVSCADATATTTVTSGHRFVPAGWYQNSSVGLQAQIVNTGSFAGINATSYPKHKGNTFAVGGQLTRAKLFQAIAQLPATPGGTREVVCLVNPFSFVDLAAETDTASTFMITTGQAAESKIQGTTELVYKAPKAVLRVVCSDFQKPGQATIFDPAVAVRIGGTDITMRGVDGRSSITLELPTKSGFQMRALSQQAALLRQMNVNLALTGIVNTGGFSPAA